MKRFNLVLAAILGLVLISGISYGQRGPGHRGPGKGFGRPDTTHTGGGKGGDPGKPFPRPNGPFGLSDSCFRVFLSMLPPDQAALLTSDLETGRSLDSVGRELRKELKAALKARDSATVANLFKQLKDNFNAMVTLEKEMKKIITANQAILEQVRQDCMGFAKRDTTIKPPHDSLDDHHKNPNDSTKGGGPGNGGRDTSSIHIKVAPIMPNPVHVGGTIKFMYGVEAAAGTQVQVTITISDAMGNLVKTVSDGLVDVGVHDVSIDLTGMTPGIYILRLQAGTEVCSQKLVIQ